MIERMFHSFSLTSFCDNKTRIVIIIIMISCNKVDLFDDEQCKNVIELLDVYARDLMGGGEELSADVKKNLPAELR